MPEIRPRADVLAAGQRDAGSTRTSTGRPSRLKRVIKVVGRLTMTAWLALEGGLLIRGQVRGKGRHRAGPGNALAELVVIITAAVVAAGMLTGVVNNAAAWPSRLSAVGIR